MRLGFLISTMSGSGRKSGLSKAIDAYHGKERLLLTNLYEVLKEKVELHAVVDSWRGAKLGNKWFIDLSQASEQKDVENLVADDKIIIELCDYLNSVYCRGANTVYELFAWTYLSNSNMRIFYNLSTFCLGGHIASSVRKGTSKTRFIDDLYEALRTDNTSITRSFVSTLANRAIRYFGFIATTGLDNLFSKTYTRESVCKTDITKYKKLLQEANVIGKAKFEVFIRLLKKDHVLHGFIDAVMLKYNYVHNQKNLLDSPQALFDGNLPKSPGNFKLKSK
jgi:hypothetical protein